MKHETSQFLQSSPNIKEIGIGKENYDRTVYEYRNFATKRDGIRAVGKTMNMYLDFTKYNKNKIRRENVSST